MTELNNPTHEAERIKWCEYILYRSLAAAAGGIISMAEWAGKKTNYEFEGDGTDE